MGLIDKAKDATGAAAEKAAALKEQAGSAVTGFKEQAQSKIGDALEAGLGQATEALAEFGATLPVLKLAGFTLDEVSLDVGLSPKIHASFAAQDVPEAETERVLAEHANDKLATMLIRTLTRAAKLQAGLSIGGLKPKGITVTMGLSPVVSIRFGS